MTLRSRTPSPQTLSVLQSLGADSERWAYGLEISRETRLKSGTLYPILNRLAERGWLEGRWVEAEQAGRPPRHAYRLTATGRAALRAAAKKAAPASFRSVPA